MGEPFRLVYATLLDFPQQVANRVQIANMSRAFSSRVETVLLASYFLASESEVRRQYRLPDRLRIRLIGRCPRRLRPLIDAARIIRQLFILRPDLIYVREEKLAWLISWTGKTYFYEMHNVIDRYRHLLPRIVRRSRRVVVVNQGIKDELIDLGFPTDRIVVAPNGVDPDHFAGDPKPGLLKSGRIKVVYTGRFTAWKGVDTLCDAAAHLPDSYHCYLVGGYPGEETNLRERVVEMGLANRITVIPHQSYDRIAAYICSADVLVIPNRPNTEESIRFTSPLKVFEFLASGRPVVASDLPSIRRLVDERLVTFFTPDDPVDLARAIEVAHSSFDGKRKTLGLTVARRNSWRRRAADILSLVRAD